MRDFFALKRKQGLPQSFFQRNPRFPSYIVFRLRDVCYNVHHLARSVILARNQRFGRARGFVDLSGQIGDRSASRLAEMCEVVAMTGTDRRKPGA